MCSTIGIAEFASCEIELSVNFLNCPSVKCYTHLHLTITIGTPAINDANFKITLVLGENINPDVFYPFFFDFQIAKRVLSITVLEYIFRVVVRRSVSPIA